MFCSFALTFLALPSRAHASFLHGETLDRVAGAIAWFAFILVPPVLIGAFLLVHILPEKVAEKRHHPQLGAIKCLCLLSLCFGGLLWPIAWLWAYTKPVLHKMAYGTDVDDSHGKPVGKTSATTELEQLRARVAELEAGDEGREGVMEVILLGIYGFFVWLIFYKFKWLPMNFCAACIVITLPIVAMMALFLLLNISAPASDDVRAMNYVVPIVPRVTGQVIEVPIQPNRPIKKGDVLFKIDPVPFEAAVKAAEDRRLPGAKDQR